MTIQERPEIEDWPGIKMQGLLISTISKHAPFKRIWGEGVIIKAEVGNF